LRQDSIIFVFEAFKVPGGYFHGEMIN
jgi:hypothetical protein